MIPRILFRTVPAETSDEVERFWRQAQDLHPGWEFVTYREPIAPILFPVTSHLWDSCKSGAQKAGLIRLEALAAHGGVYIDADVELYRRLDPLLPLTGFGLWEDHRTVPDFVLGATPNHPAIDACVGEAMRRVAAGDGAWATGPGVTTSLLRDRDDFLLLPPASFAPYHYRERHRRNEDHKTKHPYSFGAHHWAHSWRGN